jgi:outer membrane immunogenic protein
MNTKTTLLASAAAVVGGAALALTPTAQAADLPVKAQPAPYYAPPIWTGFYIGGHVGGAAQRNDIWTESAYSGSSVIAGGQIGYNWQSGNFVYGWEADGSWLSDAGFEDFPGGGTYGSNINWLSTVRARMGLAFGPTLAYVTGGVAFGEVEVKDFRGVAAVIGVQPTNGNGSIIQASTSDVRVGWTVGGGIEHMFLPNWTVAAEGLFVDLGDHKTTLNFGNGKSETVRTNNTALIGRLKVNYKF